ncbi:putative Sensor histidine kinase (HWE family) with a GAF domain [Bradyrhizobium sp. ORS 375]|uniref:HWE histidine kinase domain-containing protein n=1 Tax=Bradyrhizobium sp. (strain ORS 375) TaxID=566679 RepID=UPI0002405E79|nr:HWE histidine kinase domain-containing protein [Bradyrhizobium sp. ORS 375]CCD94585.1 putative Sensor histidine kinase (HWE family) with a GAF domain [Bradyrhizobium sp. ORS 375]
MTSDRDASAPDRLTALLQTELLDSPPEPGFDRVTRLTTRLLQAPAAIIALVDRDRQFFKSSIGLCEPWASQRETPLSHSFCQHVVTSAEPLVIGDATRHPLVKDNLAIPSLGVIAYLGVPLKLPSGEVIGALCAIDHEPRQWSEDDIAQLTELSEIVMDEIALRTENARRRSIEQHQRVLVHELNHRVKNTLALVDSVIALSIRADAALAEFGETLRGRIAALTRSHALALDRGREAIALNELVCAELAPLQSERVAVDGPIVQLAPGVALYLSMGLHELVTNAVKYGALSTEAGRVALRWTHADERLKLSWQENGGPPVTPPARNGFGSLLFERILGAALKGEVTRDFAPDGLKVTFDLPLAP